MAVALVQSGTMASSSESGSGTLSVNATLGSPPSSSNVLIAVVTSQDFNAPVPSNTPPAGWTSFSGDRVVGLFNADGNGLDLYWRTGTTATSFTWTMVGNGSGSALFVQILEFSGASTVSPFGQYSSAKGSIGASATTVVSPSLTAAKANLFPLSILQFDATGPSETTPGAPASYSAGWSSAGNSAQTTWRSETTTATGPLTTLSQSVSATYTYTSGLLKQNTDYFFVIVFIQPPFTAVTQIQTASGTSAASTSLVVTYGSTPTSGNKLIAFIAQGANAVASTGPAGWTLANSRYSTDALELWWKDAGVGEPTTYTWTLSTSAAVGDATGFEFSNVLAGASGINQSGTSTGTASKLTTASVTPSVLNTQPIAAWSGIVTSWTNMNTALIYYWIVSITATSTSYSCQQGYQTNTTVDTTTAISAYNNGPSSTRKLSIIALLAPTTGTANVVTATDAIGAITETATRAAQAFTRSGSDSVGAITDTTARIVQFLRSSSDSIGAITDTPIRSTQAFSRTSNDAVGAISETVSKVQSFSRSVSDGFGSITDTVTKAGSQFTITATDAIGAISDTVSRAAQTFTRNVSDSFGSISDTASRAAQSFSRTVTDTLVGITDTPARHVAISRSSSDGIPALSDSLAENVSLARALSDSVASPSNTVTRSPQGFSRSTSDALGGLGETLSKVQSFPRTAADSLSALSETLARAAQVFTRSASDAFSGIGETLTRSAQTFTRTANDSVPALSDTPLEKVALARIASDAVATPSDSLSRAPQAFSRTTGDVLASVADTANRGAQVIVRSSSDTVPAISEAVSEIVALPRASSDAIGAISEVVSKHQTFSRSATDALNALGETLSKGAQSFTRSVGDALGGISDAISRSSQAFSRVASDVMAAITDGLAITRGTHLVVSDMLTGISESVSRSSQGFIRSAFDAIPTPAESVARLVAFRRSVADAIDSLRETLLAVFRGPRTQSQGISFPPLLQAQAITMTTLQSEGIGFPSLVQSQDIHIQS